MVSHKSIRQWTIGFGADFARRLHQRRPKPGATSHLDEVFLRITGAPHYLRRAVGQRGAVLDFLVQERRDAVAAKRFFRRLLSGLQTKPRRLVTDGLRSYRVARREVPPDVRHVVGRRLCSKVDIDQLRSLS